MISLAPFRFNASAKKNNSIRLVSAGFEVGWMTTQVAPLTFSLMVTLTSELSKRKTWALDKEIFNIFETSSERFGFAEPEKSLSIWLLLLARDLD